MSTEGARKNKERLEQIQSKGGARLSVSSENADLAQMSKRPANSGTDEDENEKYRSKMNESRSSSSSRKSRKIHGYGLGNEDEEQDQVSYTSVNPADKKDGKTYTKKYLP